MSLVTLHDLSMVAQVRHQIFSRSMTFCSEAAKSHCKGLTISGIFENVYSRLELHVGFKTGLILKMLSASARTPSCHNRARCHGVNSASVSIQN